DITLLWKPLRELAGMIESVRRRVGPAEAAENATPSLDLFAASAERERLRAELAGRWAEFERLALQLTTGKDDMARLRAELELAMGARNQLQRELRPHRAKAE